MEIVEINLKDPVAQAVFDRPFVRYITDDGRRYLYANPHEKFDMIFIDPLWSFTAGHNNLYSREAMLLYREHLTENGVFCAWINERQFIPHTAAAVFAYTDFFPDYLVNRQQPIEYESHPFGFRFDKFPLPGTGSAAKGLQRCPTRSVRVSRSIVHLANHPFSG